MTPKWLIMFILLLVASMPAMGQAMLQIQPQAPEENAFLPKVGPQISNAAFQPGFVQENPTGYSYLCRLELKIEARSPVGVWLKLNDEPLVPGRLRSNADVRFKLLKF